MGANMVRRLTKSGHDCVVFDVNADAVQTLVGEGSVGSDSLEAFVHKLAAPRNVWIMVPAAFVDSTIDNLVPLLDDGDTIVDGGNSYYRDDIRRAEELAAQGVHYVDVATLAPGIDAAPRTLGRTGEAATAELGYLHCGPSGAGHFVKMVHNGIEYGIMAAYAEGLAILHDADIGARDHDKDAETAPLQHPEFYKYDVDVASVAELWRRGSVVGSWLLDLTAAALAESPTLEEFSGRVSDSGEGRWTVQAAVEIGVPAAVLTASLYERFASQGNATFSNKLQSAMRKQFGGHMEKRITDADAR